MICISCEYYDDNFKHGEKIYKYLENMKLMSDEYQNVSHGK